MVNSVKFAKMSKGKGKRKIMRAVKKNVSTTQSSLVNNNSLVKSKIKSIQQTILKIFSILFLFFALTLFLMRVETKNFFLKIFSANEISFSISKEDSLKSPLCNCPNPSLNNYGFLQFFKDVNISNSNDTTSYTITSPSPSNLTSYPSHQFEADVYLLQKKEFGEYDIDSIILKPNYLQKSELLNKTHFSNLYFLSIINSGNLNAKFLSNNCISTLLPGKTSKIKLRRNIEKYSNKLSSITVKYDALFKNPKVHDDAFLEFFGPKIAFYSDSLFELLGEKGPLLKLGTINEQEKIYRNSFLLIVVDVPYTARISLGKWGKEYENHWQDELLIDKHKAEGYKAGLFYNHIPWLFQDSANKILFYDFLNDPNAKYLPAVFPQPIYNFSMELRNPLNQSEYESLKIKCSEGDRIYQNPKYINGVTFYEMTPLQLQLPNSLDSSFSKYIKEMDVSYKKARKNAELVNDIFKKYSSKTMPVKKNFLSHIVYYYPEIPDKNGIYYYGEIDSMSCNNANIKYSFGITGSKEVDDCELSLNNLIINNQKPYYTQIPITQSDEENNSEMKIKGQAKMYINKERAGDRLFSNPFLQSLGLIFSLLGIGLIGLFSSSTPNKKK